MIEGLALISSLASGFFVYFISSEISKYLKKFDPLSYSNFLFQKILPERIKLGFQKAVMRSLAESHHERWNSEYVSGLSTFLFLSSLSVTSFILPFWLSLSLSVFLFFSPLLYLRRLRNSYVEEVQQEFPLLLETVATCMQGGTDFFTAIKGASSAVKGRWKRELEEFIKNSIWEGNRERALRLFADRVNVPEVRDFAEKLIFSQKTGAGISTAIQELAGEMRRRYFERVEERALKLPQKMMLPLLLIFISVFIYLIGPVMVGINMEVMR